jgi:hypothetical protein
MMLLKKHCWIFLVPLLAAIYWKKSKTNPVIKLPPSSFTKDSVFHRLHDDMKTFVVK